MPIARQFTIEYAALFEGILPALQRLGFPLPLSGTSNHFRRSRLVEAGAWDPYNLTEDADLGLRFARLGCSVEMIESTTWEEAPTIWKVWLGQRTRWIKGWMQTYLVHMRHPGLLMREIGGWGFLGMQLTFGAMMLSALVHPWFYVALIVGALSGEPVFMGEGVIWTTAMVVLMSGYVTGVALPALAALRRSGGSLALSALWHPLYWLAISIAAYRAVFDLIARPYYWEKTPHRGSVTSRRRQS
ncbi:MAG: glycosyltransferase family 2 protein [Hyphomicrobium sp.]